MSKQHKKMEFVDITDHGEEVESEISEIETPKQKSSESPANLPEPEQPHISLRVYATVSGIRWDQMAGFLSHAKARNLGARSLKAWHQEYAQFMSKPV